MIKERNITLNFVKLMKELKFTFENEEEYEA